MFSIHGIEFGTRNLHKGPFIRIIVSKKSHYTWWIDKSHFSICQFVKIYCHWQFEVKGFKVYLSSFHILFTRNLKINTITKNIVSSQLLFKILQMCILIFNNTSLELLQRVANLFSYHAIENEIKHVFLRTLFSQNWENWFENNGRESFRVTMCVCVM